MDLNDLFNRFTYHKPKEHQVPKFEAIRKDALNLAVTVNGMCPDSREKSLAITKIEEAVSHANAAIARNE